MSLLDIKKESTPEEFSNYLKKQGGLHWNSEEQFWVVTDYALAETLLKHSDLSADRASYFAARMSDLEPSMISEFLKPVSNMMVTNDAPKHTHLRKFAYSGMSDSILDEFAPTVEKTVKDLISKIKDSEIEFVSQIAQELPSIVLADLLGIPQKDREMFYQCANSMTQFFGAGTGYPRHQALLANQSAEHLFQYFQKMIEERMHSPQNDFISRLLQKKNLYDVNETEMIAQVMNILIAGKVTTTDQMANNMFLFLSANKDLNIPWALMTGKNLSSAIEEANRLDPSVNFVFRVLKKDMQMGNCQLREGETVFISIHAVNRDPLIFTDPDNFLMSRHRNVHLSFGLGIHYCLGAKLARIQMKILFTSLLEKFPNLKLISFERKHQSLAFSGFESMHLSLGVL